MEHHISLSLIIFFLTLFYLFTKLKTSTSPHTNNNLPPQPWKLPLIGHLHHLLGSLPHIALTNLSQNLGPIFHLRLGEFTFVVISSPDLAKQVMKTNDLSLANRPKLLSAEIVGYNYTDVIFSPYGEYWRQMRKICILELLSAKKVGSFKSIRDQESWSLVECMVNKGPVTINLTEKIFSTINVIATRVAVGSRCKDHGMLVELIEQLVSLSGGFDVCDLFPSFKVLHLVTGMRGKLMRIHSKIDKMLDGIISDHQECRAGGGRTEQNEDLLDVLLRLKDDGGLQFPLTYDNIKAVILVSTPLTCSVKSRFETVGLGWGSGSKLNGPARLRTFFFSRAKILSSSSTHKKTPLTRLVFKFCIFLPILVLVCVYKQYF
ncbi:putative premnaspirodiene oxygenase [Helianthus annuus]|uniref:Premnaspirodiene oxygenase n=1 Tax=Helianthus annuus TaxID=4232 RepID=A0A9K3IFW0_HELAN|nr:putative premnaspirodiene oxygenase [Helianthus annuus]KAJ0553942.1 putative premnaspirodiene oxygenase [Helianthus annuus]KAJ0898347.1 putative premnaspirodiene oxygenase [Helianthus annuus]